MKKKLSLFTLTFFLFTVFALFSNQEEVKSYEIDFTAGLKFSYNAAKIELGQEGIENSLFYPYLVLEVDVDIFSYLTLGVIAGYNQNNFKDPIDFTELPLSLRLNDERRNSMVFGLNLESEFVSFGYFSLLARGEFLYFKLFKTEKAIELPIVTGNAAIENSFYQLTVDLFLQYDGLTGVTLFLGPQLNLLDGKVSISEKIEDIEADQITDYRQKNFIGLASGINIEMGSSLELILIAELFSKTAFSAGLFYVF